MLVVFFFFIYIKFFSSIVPLEKVVYSCIVFPVKWYMKKYILPLFYTSVNAIVQRFSTLSRLDKSILQ